MIAGGNIYQVMDKNVYDLLIVDGRWDMQSLLQGRLLSVWYNVSGRTKGVLTDLNL